MAFFLPQRWRRQPQGPVEIDRNHHLGSKVHYAHAPWLGETAILPGKRWVPCAHDFNVIDATQPMIVATRFGKALNMHRTGSFRSAGIVLDTDVPENSMATTNGSVPGGSVFAVVARLDPYSSSLNSFGRFRSLGDYIGLTTTDRRLLLNLYSGTRATGDVSIVDGYSGSLTLNFIGGGSQTWSKFYAGRDVVCDATNGNYSVGAFRGWRGSTPDAPINTMISFTLRTDLLNEGEIFALDENAYQVLRPLRPIFYSLPSASFQFARPSSDILVGAWQGVTA